MKTQDKRERKPNQSEDIKRLTLLFEEFNHMYIDNFFLNNYKQPTKIQIKGISDPYTGQVSLVDVESICF